MTPEDLQAIRGLLAEFRTELRAEFRQEISAVEQRLNTRLDRAVEALTLNLSALRAELTRRMETLEHRIDVITPIVLSIDSRLAPVIRWADRIDRDNRTLEGAQTAQQRAIDQLAAQMADIQRRLGNLERQ